MRGLTLRAAALGAVTVLVCAGAARAQAGAQAGARSPILSTLEVKKLVASGDPADNARLAAHFSALADQYAADAERHKEMAQAFIASPTRRTAVNAAADHCKRLAELNTEAAKTLRELAAHHDKLAAGAASTAPKGAGRFESGAGAKTPTAAELSALAAKARTPADHHSLEEYFLTAAKRYTADANEHVAMAQAYRGTKFAQGAAHCDRLVQLSRDAAKEATAAAAVHKGLAGVAR
jgi:hypothetical protein